MMFRLVLTTAILWTVSASKLTDCPVGELKNIINKFIVKYDPSKYFDGNFIEYYVSPCRREPLTCAATTYFKEDGIIKSRSIEKELNEKEVQACTETHEVTATNGVFKIQGKYLALSEKDQEEDIEGNFFTFYADEYVIAYYFCEFIDEAISPTPDDDDGSYDVVVGVRKDKMAELLSERNNKKSTSAVKKSVDAAMKKLDEMVAASNAYEESHAKEARGVNFEYILDEPVIVEDEYLDC